jgi:DivIVA domain-containing protein
VTLTPEDVRSKQFKTVRGTTGYDMDEVDNFLDQIEEELGSRPAASEDSGMSPDFLRLANELEQSNRENTQLSSQIEQLKAQKATAVPDESPSAGAARILELAQKTADEHVEFARREADRLLAEARAEAATVEAAAASVRESFESRLDSLRSFEREYRARLRDDLDGFVRRLEGQSTEAGFIPEQTQQLEPRTFRPLDSLQ